MVNPNTITQQVVESILAQKLPPGERLGEQQLADLFKVSRTLVREALMQLQARGFIEVRPRKGWYVVEPSFVEARHAFDARRAVETGMLRNAGKPLQTALRELRQHVAQERKALTSADKATRSFLLADFHVCMARCIGNPLLVDVVRDLTARTTLVATLYQSTHDARQSCNEHAAIVAAMGAGDMRRAEDLLSAHINSVHDALVESSGATVNPVNDRLRASLAPLNTGISASSATPSGIER